MIFKTRVNGIPCQCHVTHYRPYIPATRESPPEYAEFEYDLLDLRGRSAPWLNRYITQAVEDRLFEEYHIESRAQERELAEIF